MLTVQHLVTLNAQHLPAAQGGIDPDTRVQSGEISAEALEAFLHDLSQYYTAVSADGDTVPSQCVDGRSRKDGTYEPEPKAAAGTFSAVLGDALTNGSHRPAEGNAAMHAREVYSYLLQHGYKIGGHDADHAGAGGCGCGAEDNLELILMFIRDNGPAIKAFLKSIGVDVADDTHSVIVQRAAALLDEKYAVPGAELRDVFITLSGPRSVETLTGPHHEVVLVINTEANSTLDRERLAEAYGDRFQAFELDVPSLQTAANALSLTPAESEQKFAAMLYYNVATAAVLAGPSLRIAVR